MSAASEHNARIPVTLCCWDYDRTLPLLDGRVAIAGVEPSFTVLNPVDAFARASSTAEFDVTELSLSYHIIAVANGSAAYAGIPVFLSRTYRHSIVYVNTDKGINAPADLKGKTIGLPQYDMTAAVVIRGLLRDRYGVHPTDVAWRVGDLHTLERPSLPVPKLAGIDIQPLTGRTLDAELARGTLDAVISVHEPPSFVAGHPKVRRLFPEWRRAEQEYAAETGVFPIMHLLGVRKELLAGQPWIAQSLYRAFDQAKAIAIDALSVTQAPKVTLPWVAAELAATRAVLGRDFWPYGIEKNRRSLEAMLRYSHDEGLCRRKLAVEELFAQETYGL